jgi:hypothetical protein
MTEPTNRQIMEIIDNVSAKRIAEAQARPLTIDFNAMTPYQVIVPGPDWRCLNTDDPILVATFYLDSDDPSPTATLRDRTCARLEWLGFNVDGPQMADAINHAVQRAALGESIN